MQGKILGIGIISGDDGNRYKFEIEDIQNLEGRSGEMLTGCEVDFNITEDKAKEIFITKGSLGFNNLASNLTSNSINGIKLKAYISIGCMFLTFIPFIGMILAIACCVLEILIVLALKATSQSKTLLKNIILGFAMGLMGGISFAIFGGFSLILSAMTNPSNIAFLPTDGLGIGIALFILFEIAAFYFWICYKREVAFITNQKFFLWAAYLRVLGFITAIIWIGWIFMIIALVMEIFAWVKFKEIKKREEEDNLPWF